MIARHFEDLIFWQKARELTRLVYSSTRNGAFQKNYGLMDQIERASVSVMSNIAEGFGRGANKEFIQFLFVAKGSVAELQSQLYVALDQEFIDGHTFEQAYGMAAEIIRMINAFVKSLKKDTTKGLKGY